MGKFFRNQRGQAMVELALVLPILILLLLCIMEGGRIFSGYLELESACRDGARYASVNNVTENEVALFIKSRLTLLNEDKLDPVSCVTTITGSGSSQERQVEVRLNYQMEVITPIISSLTGNPLNLKARMVMRGE